MKSKIISIALLVTLLLGMTAAIVPIHADIADVEFFVDPATNSFNFPAKPVNSTFTVTVWMRDALPLAGIFSWQITMLYDATQLLCTNATQALGDSQYIFYGMSTVAPLASFETGSVQIMDSLYSGTGSGLLKKLANFTFKIIKAPGKYETLNSTLNIDNVDTFWGDDVPPPNTNYYDPIRTNGAYQLKWTAPPNPHLEVTPPASGLIFGPGNCVGQEFDTYVTLKAIDAAWALHNVSFTLTYDAALLEIAHYVIGPFWTTLSVDNTTTPGAIAVKVAAPSAPSGDVLLITITFRIIHQNTSPDPDETSPLALTDIVIWDTSQLISTDDPVDSLVTIRAFIPFTPPHFEVSSPTLGPGPVPVGTLFDVTVSVKELNALAYFIGYDFRLSYDASVITPVTASEGPFLPYYAALEPGSLGTWWAYWFEPDTFGPNVLVGNIIYPNASGLWWYPFPEGNGVVATITFRCDVEQSYGEAGFSSYLNIVEQDWVGIDNPAGAQNIVDVPHLDAVNGTFTLTVDWPGRMIDVYTQYPAPFGGQGLQMPSDMFWPQKQVELYANVTYNYWPVQEKDVAFEVRDPHGTLVTIQVARTDVNGVAHTWYRIPWPCDHPEDLFGVWTVTATVDLACIVINDTLKFHFDYMVEIFKVTTDKFQVNHYECFNVIIEYGSHAQQEYPVVIQAILYDNLNVPVAQGYVETTVGGTVFCQYKNNTVIIPLCIPKYAFAGLANIYVNVYDALPTQGGSALTPTYGLMNPFGYSWPIGSTVPQVAIQPR
jgi:hypothetical protein